MFSEHSVPPNGCNGSGCTLGRNIDKKPSVPGVLAVYNILMNRCRHFLVSGQVQGVFFRAATEAAARRLGLTGWVRNLADGSVELVACGEEAKLMELERWLWQGPPRARVEQVRSREAELQTFSDFSVRG